MARPWYGGTLADYAIDPTGRPVAGAIFTVSTGPDGGGVPVTDLLDESGDPVTEVTSNDRGFVRFQPPDGTTGTLYLRDGDGRWYAINPITLADDIAAAVSTVDGLTAVVGDGSDLATAKTLGDAVEAAGGLVGGLLPDAVLPASLLRRPDLAPVNGQGAAFVSRLDHGLPAVVTLWSDSTGDDDPSEEWFTRWLRLLAGRFPGHRVEESGWNHTAQAYDPAVTLQAGPAGPAAVTVDDTFTAGSGSLLGRAPDTAGPYKWSTTGVAPTYSVSGGVATLTTVQGTILSSDGGVRGGQSAHATGTINTTQASPTLWRLMCKLRDAGSYVTIAGTVATTGSSWSLSVLIAGVSRTLAVFPTLPVPQGAGVQAVDATITVAGTAVTATVNGITVAGVLTAAEARSLYPGSAVGILSTVPGTTWDRVTLTSTPAPPTLTAYRGARPGSILSYQSDRQHLMFPEAADLLILSSCHNYAGLTAQQWLTPVASETAPVKAAAVKTVLDKLRAGTGAVAVPQTKILDTFGRVTADLRGSVPDIGGAYGGVSSNAGEFSANGSRGVYNNTGAGQIVATTLGLVAGDQAASIEYWIDTNGGAQSALRLSCMFVDDSNYLGIYAVVGGGANTWVLIKRVGNVQTTLATFTPPVALGLTGQHVTAQVSLAGTAVSGTLVGPAASSTVAGVITAGEQATFSTAFQAGWLVNQPNGQVDNFRVDVTTLPPTYPDVEVIVSGQNPQTPAYQNAGMQLARLTALRRYALANGWGAIPVSEAFLATPNWETLISSDGIHPLDSGSALWAQTVDSYVAALSRLTP